MSWWSRQEGATTCSRATERSSSIRTVEGANEEFGNFVCLAAGSGDGAAHFEFFNSVGQRFRRNEPISSKDARLQAPPHTLNSAESHVLSVHVCCAGDPCVGMTFFTSVRTRAS